MTSSIARQPQGVPTGGQFAPSSHAEPGVSLISRSPKYQDTADTRGLEADAEFFGHEVGFNSRTGNLELATGTASYTAMLEFQPDGNVIRTHNGEPVYAFPASMRKAQTLERFAANRWGDLSTAAAGAHLVQPGE